MKNKLSHKKTKKNKKNRKNRKDVKKKRRVTGKYRGGGSGANNTVQRKRLFNDRLFNDPKIRAMMARWIPPPASERVLWIPELVREITNYGHMNNTIKNPIDKSLRNTKLKQVTGIKAKAELRNDITDEYLNMLWNPDFINITKIDLNGCTQITNEGLKTIADSLPNLTHIDLYDTQITDEGLKTIATSECRYKLTTLILGGDVVGQNITDYGMGWIGANCRNLKSIHISDTRVRNRGLEFLMNCTEITDINLKNTLVSDTGVTLLATILGDGLESINLAGGQTIVSDTSVEAIANNCPNLKNISLARRNITDMGVQALALACPLLEVINLNICPVTNEGISKLIPQTDHPGCPNLTEIHLKETNVTENKALELIRSLPNLIEIHMPLSSISSETTTALQQIKSQRPDLRFF